MLPDLDPEGTNAIEFINRMFSEKYESFNQMDREMLIYWIRQLAVNYDVCITECPYNRKGSDNDGQK